MRDVEDDGADDDGLEGARGTSRTAITHGTEFCHAVSRRSHLSSLIDTPIVAVHSRCNTTSMITNEEARSIRSFAWNESGT